MLRMAIACVVALTVALAAEELAGSGGRHAQGSAGTPFSVVEATIADMQAAMTAGRISAVDLVKLHLERIAQFEDRLNAVIAINPSALSDAAARDRERAAGRVRGPLHGIPIALKDNIHTTSVATTGGALAFDGLVPPYEATLTTLLVEAGAVIIAKTALTELANWTASGMPGNYSGLTGYAMNPYDPRRDPREANFDGRPVMGTGGSSSGVGTAASFWAANIGTETSGSILSPSNQNMLAGIKPTVGRVSRHGVIPITADQDTPGPMARTVADAALVLGAIEGAAPDANDPATRTCQAPPNRDYRPFLQSGALKGARIGIPRAFYYDAAPLPTAGAAAAAPQTRGGLNADQAKVMTEAIAVLRREGAVVVDPADIPSVVNPRAADNMLAWNVCSGLENGKGKDADCSIVFKYGMKRDFNAWLTSLGPAAPVKTLTELRQWNIAHQRAGAIKYGQAQLDISDEMDVSLDRARYQADREKDLRLSATQGLDPAFKTHQLDAMLFPGASGAAIAAKPGYPTVIVPFAQIPNSAGPPFPAGFTPQPVPYGVSFTGLACSEPKLVALAYAFEQATRRRRPPMLR